jgi:hypothetical protein
MPPLDEAALPGAEREFLTLIRETAGWRVESAAGGAIDATHPAGDARIRFSSEAPPTIVSDAHPEGTPFALAALAWFGVRSASPGPVFGEPTTIAEWSRPELTAYRGSWDEIVEWLRHPIPDVLAFAAERHAALTEGLRSEADVPDAVATLRADVAAQSFSRLTVFLAHLDRDAAVIARGMLDANWTVEEFWGPVQMDVWMLALRHGPVRAVFDIERGFSGSVIVQHDDRAPRKSGTGSAVYGQLWQVWARRPGVPDRAVDSGTPGPARNADWPAVMEWFATASADDLAAVDRLLEGAERPRL